jgi:hypothetical protein
MEKHILCLTNNAAKERKGALVVEVKVTVSEKLIGIPKIPNNNIKNNEEQLK